MKHTPGPWKHGHNTMNGFDTEHLVYTDNDSALFVAAVQDTLEGHANAALIAEAPKMLKALKAIVEACDEPTPHIPKIKHIAENAIAKTG